MNAKERKNVFVNLSVRLGMIGLMLALAFSALGVIPARAAWLPQVSLATLGTPYTQDFDTLSNAAGSTDNTLAIDGWYLTETGGGVRDNELYGVDNGASLTGDTYSYGAAGATDRALGGLLGGTLISTYGASFTNNTGYTIDTLAISYIGEEWHLGFAGRTDRLDFQYSLNAASLSDGSWTNVNALDFTTPDATAPTGAKDGNAAGYRAAVSSIISGLSIPNGATFWVRWNDFDASNADDGLAVDDFSLTAYSCQHITVTNNADSGAGSLRQAIADACSGGTIDFDNDYTIPLATELAIAQDLTIDGAGHSVTVSGNHATRVFNVTAGTVAFNHLTIADGNVQTNDCGVVSLRCGGGLILQNNSAIVVMVTNSAFSGNNAAYGGGIYKRSGTLTVTNSAFSSNSATEGGGGIRNFSGSLTVTNSTFSGNSATEGGGIFNVGTLTVMNSAFLNNTAGYRGGGLYNDNAGILTVSNSTLSGNTAANDGGGIINYSTLTLTSSTISGNSAPATKGAGILNGLTATITNTIIANNISGNNCGGTFTDGGGNLAWGDTTCSGALNANPLLGALGNYGGSTQTFPLLPGSPAIDAGDSAACAAAPVNGLDQRGVARPAACDIGAFESRGFTLAKTGGDNQSTPVNAAFPNLLTLIVSSPFGEPVGGGLVTFTPPSSGASAAITSSPMPITSGAGTVDVIATANGIPGGPYNVVASASGADSVNFALTNVSSDTTPPVVTVPANMIVEATSAAGAVVNFVATATDETSPPNPAVTCAAPSGSIFPLGVNTVNCSATDTAGNTGTNSFTITVRDTTAPIVTVPANMIEEATSAAGAVVTYPAAAATDSVDPLTPAVTCVAPSGSTFPLGVNTVNCSATDTAGNTGTNSFTITVRDTTAPIVTVPANMIEEATSAAGAVVTYPAATATDSVDPLTPAVTCVAPSGSTFPLGVNTVNCSATDTAGNTGTNSFTITVRDTTAPVVTVPANMTVEATGPTGAVVTYPAATATDTVDPLTPAVTCVAPSGSIFPLGVNTVNCSATDTAGNTGTNSFTITVRDTTAPIVTVPANMTVGATSPAGAVVNYSGYSAIDTVDPLNPVTSCVAPSGSTFPIGVNTVNCSATDTAGNTGTNSFTITVQNTAPVAGDDTYTTTMSVLLNGTTVLVNDTDVQGDPLTAVKVTDPAHASAFTFNADGTFTYQPENGFRGTDTFTYMANDGLANSNVATVSILVSPLVMTFNSISKYDGWILESLENSNKGGTALANQILRLGDSLRDQQYRSILSFNASTLPPGAVIVGATVKVHQFDVIGVNPFTIHGNLITDVRKGSFSGSPTLTPSDFQAAASKSNIGRFVPAPGLPKWYQLVLAPLNFQYINPSGITQFRLRFTIQDNDNMLDDIVRFASGDSVRTGRPLLVIEYYVP